MMTMFAEAETPIEMDWRFAELVARTWMEPDLAHRYRNDPVPVLAEFGLTVTSAAQAPRLEAVPTVELVIEGLDDTDYIPHHGVFCVNDSVRPAGDPQVLVPADGHPVVWSR
ncbi:hypothetical protein GCM10009839_74530 [Catenulispora yoronensis]|uniref:Uncharacterized protein n=2 Tax=Catenulispora yoronensis TaxID=450799 RepID=A0ABP5GRM1_9ACTN